MREKFYKAFYGSRGSCVKSDVSHFCLRLVAKAILAATNIPRNTRTHPKNVGQVLPKKIMCGIKNILNQSMVYAFNAKSVGYSFKDSLL